ncbi:MAG: hypothetical protein JWO12_2901 [Frankiales bacterium]|nr:hypothetical protein [Frankiales bacterium]
MTQGVCAARLPAVRRGGPLRRFLVLATSVGIWFIALVFLGSGISPGLGEPTEREWGLRILLLAAGLAVSAVPLLVFLLPAQARARHQVEALLAGHRASLTLPAYDAWGGPEHIFQLLQLTSYTVLAPPLLLLLGSAATFGAFLGEPVGAAVFVGLAAIPFFFLVATWRLPQRLRSSVGEGLASGQVVPVKVVSRLDQKTLLSSAFMTWFDAELSDGQHLVLRTPVHHPWATDARGVVEADDLVLVIGKDGHQGLLLSPSRPEDAVWLLGPVPLTRAPSRVLRDLARDGEPAGADPP